MSAWPQISRGDVVLVTFPFTDLSAQKLRPALVVGRPSGDDLILAFITSRMAPVDEHAECRIEPTDPEFRTTGLKAASVVRLNKIVTLQRDLVRRRLGRIGLLTDEQVRRGLRYVFDI